MNSTSRIWRITSLLSIVSTLFLIMGFIYAVSDVTNPVHGEEQVQESQDTRQSVIPASNNFNVVAIGDSLAKGTGDDSGGGFAKRTIELQTKQGTESKLINNLGINGLTTTRLIPLLDEKGVQYSLKEAGIILLSIGANDLFDGHRIQDGDGLPEEEELRKAIIQAHANFKEVVDKIYQINPNAILVYISLYNPFSDIEGIRDMGNKAVNAWNTVAMDVMANYKGEGSLIVPTFDLFMNNSSQYLANDHFHPNGDGYQLIAERILQGMTKPVVSSQNE